MKDASGPAQSSARLATDNDFNEHIARGCRRRLPNVELISIRDVGLAREEDPAILEWAAGAHYVVVTHDASTMTKAAYERLERALPMPGLLVVQQKLGIGQAVQRLVDQVRRSGPADLEGRVIYL